MQEERYAEDYDPIQKLQALIRSTESELRTFRQWWMYTSLVGLPLFVISLVLTIMLAEYRTHMLVLVAGIVGITLLDLWRYRSLQRLLFAAYNALRQYTLDDPDPAYVYAR